MSARYVVRMAGCSTPWVSSKVSRNARRAEDALQQANELLEQRIEERTRQLSASQARLQAHFNNSPDWLTLFRATERWRVRLRRPEPRHRTRLWIKARSGNWAKARRGAGRRAGSAAAPPHARLLEDRREPTLYRPAHYGRRDADDRRHVRSRSGAAGG